MTVIADLERRGTAGYVSPTPLFWAYLGMGDKDKAFEWLDRAIDEFAFIVIMGLKTQPLFDPLRDDPRFGAALVKARLDQAK